MVLKKLGPELRNEFLEVIDYLGRHEGMQVGDTLQALHTTAQHVPMPRQCSIVETIML